MRAKWAVTRSYRLRFPELRNDMFPTEVVILAGARSPMARYAGLFQNASAIELGACAAREAIRRAGTDPAEFDHAVFGNVIQPSSDAIYGARHVALKAGLKTETPAVTVNRLCGSGIESIAQAAQRLLLGESELILAGGLVHMTQAPLVIFSMPPARVSSLSARTDRWAACRS